MQNMHSPNVKYKGLNIESPTENKSLVLSKRQKENEIIYLDAENIPDKKTDGKVEHHHNNLFYINFDNAIIYLVGGFLFYQFVYLLLLFFILGVFLWLLFDTLAKVAQVNNRTERRHRAAETDSDIMIETTTTVITKTIIKK